MGNKRLVHVVACEMDIFIKYLLKKKYFRITSRVSNSLVSDQAPRSVEPDLGQTVCKGYQQRTLVGKVLTFHMLLSGHFQSLS